jgi:hypothetical protein
MGDTSYRDVNAVFHPHEAVFFGHRESLCLRETISVGVKTGIGSAGQTRTNTGGQLIENDVIIHRKAPG